MKTNIDSKLLFSMCLSVQIFLLLLPTDARPCRKSGNGTTVAIQLLCFILLSGTIIKFHKLSNKFLLKKKNIYLL